MGHRKSIFGCQSLLIKLVSPLAAQLGIYFSNRNNSNVAPPWGTCLRANFWGWKEKKAQHVVRIEHMTCLCWGVCTTAGLQSLPWRSLLLLQEMTAGMVIYRKLKKSLKGGNKPNLTLPFHFQWHNPQSMLTIFLYSPPTKKLDILILCIKVNVLSLWYNRCL